MAIFLLIFFLLLTAYCLLIDYYRRAWNSIPEYTEDKFSAVRISVVIAARNEENNLGEVLDCLAGQDYPADLLEVIVVDDHSTDASASIAETYSFVHVLQLSPHLEGKKQAISAGIHAASGELIVTTDADCRAGAGWLRSLASFYVSSRAKFIAAPVMIAPTRSFAGIFQSLDFLTLQGITGASVHRKFHNMGNGANLAYPKQVFVDVNGFEGVDHIPSGDDMLLMHKIAMRYPEQVFYLKNRNSIVTTKPERTWKDFMQQRVRWASKAVHFKDRRIFYVLLLTYLVNVCFVVSAVTSLFNAYSFGFFLLLLLAKIIIEFPFVNSVANFFNRRPLMKYFIFFQPLHILYIIVAGWLGRFGSYTWKSRKIKNTGKSLHAIKVH